MGPLVALTSSPARSRLDRRPIQPPAIVTESSCPMSKSDPDQILDKVTKSEATWRSGLSAERHYVVRQHHRPERPGTSALNREKRKGALVCSFDGPRETTGCCVNGAALKFK